MTNPAQYLSLEMQFVVFQQEEDVELAIAKWPCSERNASSIRHSKLLRDIGSNVDESLFHDDSFTAC